MSNSNQRDFVAMAHHISPSELGCLQGRRYEISVENLEFPEALRRIPRPPKKLYLIGNQEALSEGLAVVGARKATPYGISCAKHFANIAALKGINIISGGAYGCDAAAHQAALEAQGTTLVFLGGGCDKIYPSAHFDLFQKIIDCDGALVSEYPWDFPPLRHTFRERNRLIAGLARVTLIVEAGLPSGTFSTADEALAAGKEVLVVPGSIYSKTSLGANRLLYQGALPVVDDESFDDYLFSFFGALKQESLKDKEGTLNAQKRNSLSKTQKLLFETICAEPMRAEELIRTMSAHTQNKLRREEILIELTILEKERLIARYPDGRLGPIV